jgi:hypothetical protein
MRPKGTRRKYSERLTKKERKKIAARIIAGDKQVEVAREFGVCPDTVREVQREFGISRWRELTPEVERECVALLRLGTGVARSAKLARVSEPTTRMLMVKYGIVHAHGGRVLAPEKAAKIREAVLRRDNYCTRLAEKFHVSPSVVLKIAHEVWGEGRFLSTAWPPMQSAFPQRNFDPQLAGPDIAVQLVSRICASCFGGKLPPTDDAVFVAAMMTAFCQTILQGQPEPVVNSFAAGLSQAVNALRESENCAWKN